MTMFAADLHTHSTASDGQYTPTKLVTLAHRAGIKVMALTDHDNVDGVMEAVRTGERLGVRVLPGIEFSAREFGTYHLLGYCFDPDHEAITGLIRRMKERRENRNPRIIAYLANLGMELTMEEVTAMSGGGVIARPHFARALVRRGYVASNQEAFDRYLDTADFKAKVDIGKPPILECIDTIHAAGGRASLAHPYQIGVDHETLDALVGDLAAHGLDAIEGWYPRFTPQQHELYLHLAEKYGIHVTGGSDFHGEKVRPDVWLTPWQLELDWLLEH